ncbi:MAG TPA: carboxypeptidase regulatory-like domain-containing protein, partial [Candidatus Solibacter sp.]|nr:carboxypeptidase regulatory-like domain-containing protein [Candidatus Solibacter sp.]
LNPIGRGNAQQVFGTLTDAEGKFTISTVLKGSYMIAADRVGFVDLTPGSGSHPLELKDAGDKKNGVKFNLTPTGAITGRVLDANGEPMEGVMVGLEIGGNQQHGTTTDDRGVYRFGGLRPGKVRVRARKQWPPFPPEIRTDGTAEIHYAATYFPSAPNAKSAQWVEVAAARESTGIDIRMIRMPVIRLSGKVLGMPPGVQGGHLSIRPVNSGAQIKADGSFEVWRIDPGKYTLTAEVNQQGPNGNLNSGPIAIEVGETDLDNVTIQLFPSGELHGTVIFEDEEARTPPRPPARQQQNAGQRQALQQVRRIMLRALETMAMYGGEMKEDGSFTVPNVAAGKYRAEFSGGALYVKSMSLGPQNFDGASLDLMGGVTSAPLTLHIATAKGVVSGTVSDTKGPVGGAHVVIAGDWLERGSTRQAVTKDDGTYSIPGVAPGKYRIFVVEESDLDQLQMGLELFDDVAEKIEIRDNETVNKDLKKPAPAAMLR